MKMVHSQLVIGQELQPGSLGKGRFSCLQQAGWGQSCFCSREVVYCCFMMDTAMHRAGNSQGVCEGLNQMQA